MLKVISEKPDTIRPNTLNDLSGIEWIKLTKTWFVLKPKKRNNKNIHPASYPEELVERYIKFFTKENEWIFDPFLGVGSSLIASSKLNRNGIGIELYEKYFNFAKEKLSMMDNGHITNYLFNTDARNIIDIFSRYNMPKISLCITSPPYWNQLNNNNKRQQMRQDSKLDTNYGDKNSDLGIIENYDIFLDELSKIFNQIYAVTKNKGHLIVITNNIYKKGRVWPLAFDLFKLLSKKWIPKDEQIWCQDDKKLFPFGIFSTYVGNRSHHYCLIFQKIS